MADKLPWFPFYGADFFGDETVLEMSNEEVGAYLRLLWHQWTNGSVPSDRNRLAKLCGTRQLDLILSKFQTADDGGERLVNRKLLQIHTEQEDRRARLAQAGSKGGSSRATASLKPSYSDAQATEQSRAEQSKTETSSSPRKMSQPETEMREALGNPDAILVMESFAGIGSRAFARWAAVRQYGPGGISEKPGVTWNIVAAGLLGAASYAAEHPDKPLSERLIGSCIQRAAQPFQDAPRRPIAAGVRDWTAEAERLRREREETPQ